MINRKNPFTFIAVAFGLQIALSCPARADLFGGDDVILAQILAESIEQLTQLEQILGTGQDQISFLRQVNEGVSQSMSIMRTANSTLHPGSFYQYQGTGQMLSLIQQVYGMVPHTSNSPLQELTDNSVAEALTLHNSAFTYADGIDPEAERIKDYSQNASPLGAARTTTESMGVLIHVNDQILRTNAESLNIQSENLALMNRREKLNSEQTRIQYQGLSDAFGKMTPMSQATDLSAQ
jgi:hypothetical protein